MEYPGRPKGQQPPQDMDDDGNIDIAEEFGLMTPGGIMGNVFDYDIVRATPGQILQNRQQQAVGILIDLPGAQPQEE